MEGFNILNTKNIHKYLKKRGHKLSCFNYGGSVVQGVHFKDSKIFAYSDPRKGKKSNKIMLSSKIIINNYKFLGGFPDGD